MNKTAADVEREVEASRSDLDRTVEALKDKMTPGQLFDEASRAMGGAGQQVLSKFVEQAKENPMPLAVMGLGLAWLMSSNNSGRAPRSGFGPGMERRSFSYETGAYESDRSNGLADKAHTLADKASGMISGAKEKLASGAGAAGEGGRNAAHNVAAAAGTAAQKAGEVRQQAQQGFNRVLESEPLLIGALGLIVGAAIGAALPHTEVEDRTVGPMRDRILDKGKDLAQEGLQQAGGVAQAAFDTVKSELQQRGGDQPQPPAN
jgi:hypothetical protein